ncbi:MAG TPA: hypothetical protein DEB46_11930 [Myxococcales bacterium]|nr:hypothetical protein [Myxococcales bacterium]
MSSLLVMIALGAVPPVAGDGTPAGPKLAATDIQCQELSPEKCRLVEDLLLASFSEDQRFTAVISGKDIRNLLDLEQQKAVSGCDEAACLAQLGNALNVGHLLTSSLGKVGGQYSLSLRIMDTEAAKVIVREQAMVAGEDKLPEAVKSASAKVLQTFFDAIGVGAEATVARSKETGSVEGIAVFDLEAVHGVKQSMARVLSDILLSNLQDSGRFESVVSGEDIKQMLDMEQQKTAMGCEDDGCMAQIGGALGVPYMAVPTIGRLGGQFVLNLKILAVEEAQVKARVSKMVKREVDLPAAVLSLAKTSLEHLFEGAEVVKNRRAVQKLQRQMMRYGGNTLLAGGGLALGYSIFDLNGAQASHLAALTTDSYDQLLEAQSRAVTLRWGGLAALGAGLALVGFAPAELVEE